MIINRRNVLQLLSAMPFINIGKLGEKAPSHMKDVVGLTIKTEIQLEQILSVGRLQEYKETPDEIKTIVKIEYGCGKIYEFVGNNSIFVANHKEYPDDPLNSKNKQYFQLLDYQINPNSMTIVFDVGKIKVSK